MPDPKNCASLSDLSRRPGDAFDRITYHVTNLWRVWNGSPVRDLAESEAGYESALRELVAAVEALREIEQKAARRAEFLADAISATWVRDTARSGLGGQ